MREAAAALVAVFEESLGEARQKLAEACTDLIDSCPADAQVMRGLEKLLLDRTEFEVPDDEETPRFRATVFRTVSDLLGARAYESFEAFQGVVRETLGEDPRDLGARLYDDLPAFNPVVKFRKLTPELLLHRYNAALIQWMLLHTTHVEIQLSDADPAAWRQLFKYLKFHQLMVRIHKEKSGFLLRVDGPLSMFYQTKRYGFQLARFFPALLHQDTWRLTAEVDIRGKRKATLEVDQKQGIAPYSFQFHRYVPEELQQFRDHAADKLDGWEIELGSDFVQLPGGSYSFPDFALRHESGLCLWLELFHPWHAAPLLDRLRELARETEPTLVLGVATRLAKDEEVAEAMATNPYYAQFGFSFRDFPTVTRLKTCLKKALKQKAPRKAAPRKRKKKAATGSK